MADTDIACPACGSSASMTHLDGVTDLLHGIGGTWDLLECANCGLVYLAPPIPERRMGEYYPENYTAYGAGRDKPANQALRLLKAALMLPYTLRFGQPGYFPLPFGGGRMLDIGCGAGLHVSQMSALGWQCAGVDISEQAVENARRLNPGAEFFVGHADDLAPGERYDLISMHHVLEHVRDPGQAIAACFGLLRPGGRLAVNVPNIGSFEAKCFGRRWIGLDVPRHLLHFREPVLERFLREAGFAIKSKRPGMFASSISESFILCLPARLRRKLLHSRAGHFFYQLLLPFAALGYLLGNRGTLEIVAVKPQGSHAGDGAADGRR